MPSAQDRARELFGDSGVDITTDGRRLLWACLGTETSVHQYVSNAVAGFVQQVELLSKVAITEPHAAFAAFTHVLAGRWTFLSRTMGNISELFQPLEDTIRKRFLPALTGRKPPSDDERAVLALPARLGGLGIRNPVQNAVAEHENSMKATKPLTELIVDQVAGIGNIKDELLRLRQATHVANRDRATTAAKQLAAKLPAAQAVPSHWPLKRALPTGWLLFLSLVTGSSYTMLHFATLCACVMAGSHSLCHHVHSARVARRTPLAMHCSVQSAVTQPSGTMRWETSQPVCCGKYATTWQQSHLFSLWLVKPSLPVLSSATTRLAWTSPRVAFGAVGSRKHFLM